MRLSFVALAGGCAVLPSRMDLSDQPLPQAIAASLDHLEQRYSFTAHKGIDWEAVRSELQPLADDASTIQEAHDVIRRLVPILPDAHVQLSNEDLPDELCPMARGTYGLLPKGGSHPEPTSPCGADGARPRPHR